MGSRSIVYCCYVLIYSIQYSENSYETPMSIIIILLSIFIFFKINVFSQGNCWNVQSKTRHSSKTVYTPNSSIVIDKTSLFGFSQIDDKGPGVSHELLGKLVPYIDRVKRQVILLMLSWTHSHGFLQEHLNEPFLALRRPLII